MPLHVVLEGTRGYLNYLKTNEHYHDNILVTLQYHDVLQMSKVISNILCSGKLIYFLGTHTFIRLIKLSLIKLGAKNE